MAGVSTNVYEFDRGWLEANIFINVYGWQNMQVHYVGRQQTWRIHCKWSTVPIFKRRMHISRDIKIMCGTTLMFIKFKNVVRGVSMGPGVYFIHSAALYIQHIFSGGCRGGGCSPPCNLKEYKNALKHTNSCVKCHFQNMMIYTFRGCTHHTPTSSIMHFINLF